MFKKQDVAIWTTIIKLAGHTSTWNWWGVVPVSSWWITVHPAPLWNLCFVEGCNSLWSLLSNFLLRLSEILPSFLFWILACLAFPNNLKEEWPNLCILACGVVYHHQLSSMQNDIKTRVLAGLTSLTSLVFLYHCNWLHTGLVQLLSRRPNLHKLKG